MAEDSEEDSSQILLEDMMQEASSVVVRQRSQSQDATRNQMMTIEIPTRYYEMMDKEFKCPICRNVFMENPKQLPC